MPPTPHWIVFGYTFTHRAIQRSRSSQPELSPVISPFQIIVIPIGETCPPTTPPPHSVVSGQTNTPYIGSKKKSENNTDVFKTAAQSNDSLAHCTYETFEYDLVISHVLTRRRKVNKC